MTWHALGPADGERLSKLAADYRLHPLHLEDCQHGGQSAKIEEEPGYLFVVLKPAELDANGELRCGDFNLFLGRDFLITYEESRSAALEGLVARLHSDAPGKPDQTFYRILDGVVDAYIPILDRVSEEIDAIEDEVLSRPEPDLLRRIFSLKRSLIEMRRVLTQTRDVAGHLLRFDTGCMDPKLRPYFRDVYDHITRHIESVEMSRDLLSGALDIYLSSVANRTNESMKVLAVVSAIALPTLVVTGVFGMNFESMPWVKDPAGLWRAAAMSVCGTAAICGYLRWRGWI